MEARRHSARQTLTLRDMPERHEQGPELCIGTFGLKPPGPGHVWCWVDDPDQPGTAAPEGTPCMCVCVTLHPSPCTTASNADGLMRRAQPVGMLIANSESAGSSAAQYGSKLGMHQRLLQAASSYRHGIKAKPGCLCLCLPAFLLSRTCCHMRCHCWASDASTPCMSCAAGHNTTSKPGAWSFRSAFSPHEQLNPTPTLSSPTCQAVSSMHPDLRAQGSDSTPSQPPRQPHDPPCTTAPPCPALILHL